MSHNPLWSQIQSPDWANVDGNSSAKSQTESFHHWPQSRTVVHFDSQCSQQCWKQRRGIWFFNQEDRIRKITRFMLLLFIFVSCNFKNFKLNRTQSTDRLCFHFLETRFENFHEIHLKFKEFYKGITEVISL